LAKSAPQQPDLLNVSADVESIAGMSFEQALKMLEDIVRRLEGGNSDLETAMSDYVHGTALKDHCQKKLAEAKLKVEAIIKTAEGALAADRLEMS
jgi:exodeoxyribonuclease VII small subunit